MGNDVSSKIMEYSQQQMQEYAKKYKEMEETISTHNLTIQNLLDEKRRLSDTVKSLEETMSKKEEDMKKRISDIKSHQKKVHTELSKYKSIPEFEDILSLYTELLEFRNKIDASLSSDNLFKVSKDREEIDKLKKSNMELTTQLTSIGDKSVLHEKAAELQAAESDVNTKKDLMRQEFLKNNGRLVKIQEKMKECTLKFAETMSNAIVDTQNQFQKHKKEFSEVDCVMSKLDDNIPYGKVMNILLQQQNTLMKEIILTTGDAGLSNSDPPKIFNNLRPTPNQPHNSNTTPQMSFSNLINQDEESKYDNDDACSSILDDDISEIGSVSENPKPFKLMMYNIPNCGNDRQFVIKVLKTLTDLPLDDIVVRRIGKQRTNRPIVVCFEKFSYIHRILKKKHLLNDGPFSNVRINPCKANTEGTSKGRPNNNNSDNADVCSSIFDDDISKTGSVSETPKPFKLIMHNIPDCGNDRLFVIEVLKKLTDLPLDDIVVRRIGKPGQGTPILVCFEKIDYIHQILKTKHTIEDGPFSAVRINAYKVNKAGTSKGGPNNTSDNDDACRSIFDDDISETGSVSENPKPFKLIMRNIPDCGNDRLFVIEVLKKLTDLPLDDIVVRRIGKPGPGTPVLVCFEKIDYIHQILKTKHKIRHGPFSNVWINEYKANKEETSKGRSNNNDSDNDEACSSMFGDDISETGSVSETPKPFKLIMHNIPDCGNDRLFVIEVLKKLTDLPLDDIVVRRIGKPGQGTPILVCFEKIDYIHQILKTKHTIEDGPFSTVRINAYKVNKAGTSKGGPNNTSDNDDACRSIFDDDISETGSVSENPKPFKLIIDNIPDCGNDRLFVIEVLKKLTDLPLDDIVVTRIGKPGQGTPILVCFEKVNYIHQILKTKHTIQDGPFPNVWINEYKANKEETSKGRSNNNDSDNDEACSSMFGDDISETGSVSETPKPFKLIMHNIPDCGNDRLFVIEVLKKLTDLPLDDIVVRRIGKPGQGTPILVCFEKINYIHQILKTKRTIQDGPFAKVRINAFKAN